MFGGSYAVLQSESRGSCIAIQRLQLVEFATSPNILHQTLVGSHGLSDQIVNLSVCASCQSYRKSKSQAKVTFDGKAHADPAYMFGSFQNRS